MPISVATRSVESESRSSALIIGASFAGLATAFWLNQLGYRVTVIEAAGSLRKGGTPVDIEGEAIDALARMGLFDAVRARALPPRALEFKDANDGTIGVLAHDFESDDRPQDKYEIHRDDLLEILFTSIEGSAEVVFGQSVAHLEDGPDRITATFHDGSRRSYSLVFGCDGNRSKTRRLTFGESEEFSYFMGGYFFIKVVPNTGLLPANVSQIFSVPGRTALLNGYDDRTDISLAFRSGREIAYDYRDRAQQRRMVHDHFDKLGWKVPALLAHMDVDDEFYFDKINQIRMPAWSKGRVTLVGDAGYCVSPVAGMGGSVAILGAATLADALKRHDFNHELAFQAYDDKLRPFVEEIQNKAASVGMAFMFPSDDADMTERNRMLSEQSIHL